MLKFPLYRLYHHWIWFWVQANNMDWKINKIIFIHLFYLLLYLLKEAARTKCKTHCTLCQYAARYVSMYYDHHHSHKSFKMSVKCAIILEMAFLAHSAFASGFLCQTIIVTEGDTNCNTVAILCVNNIFSD